MRTDRHDVTLRDTRLWAIRPESITERKSDNHEEHFY